MLIWSDLILLNFPKIELDLRLHVTLVHQLATASTIDLAIQGFEAMLWLRKGFGVGRAWTVREQNQLIATVSDFPPRTKVKAGSRAGLLRPGPSLRQVTDTAFVQALYEGALGRSADATGLQSWTDALTHGASRADVAVGIAESPEAHVHLTSVIENGWRLI